MQFSKPLMIEFEFLQLSDGLKKKYIENKTTYCQAGYL